MAAAMAEMMVGETAGCSVERWAVVMAIGSAGWSGSSSAGSMADYSAIELAGS